MFLFYCLMHILMSDLKAIIVWFFPTLNKVYCIVLRIKGHEADNVTTEIAQSKNLTTERRVEDIKGAIRIRISKKNRQHNGQKKKETIPYSSSYPFNIFKLFLKNIWAKIKLWCMRLPRHANSIFLLYNNSYLQWCSLSEE